MRAKMDIADLLNNHKKGDQITVNIIGYDEKELEEFVI